jgi:hypothetical protein
VAEYSVQFWIFFFIGLVLIIAFSHRQFNEPSWQNESNIIQRLAPSDIIGRSTFYKAYLLYLGVIALIYYLLCFSQTAFQVGLTIVDLMLSRDPAGGAAGGVVGAAADGAGAGSTRQVNPLAVDPANPSFPLLVSLAMGALMRLPFVQRGERWLRGTTHWIFGIPTVPVTLLDRMLRTPVDLKAVEAELDFESGVEPYSARIERYANAGAAVLKSAFSKQRFREQLATVFAFRVWVHDESIWPTSGLTADSSTYAPLYKNVLDDIAVLEKDLELLSTPALSASRDGVTLDGKMLEELWEYRLGELARVCKDVCSVMALFAPNSDYPDPRAPTAGSLIRFLEVSGNADVVWRIQRNSALMAISLSAAWMALMGALFAVGLQKAVPEIFLAEPTNRLFDPLYNAGQWLLTGVLAYGTATYIAIHRRSVLLRRGRWTNAFGNRFWPFDEWMVLGLHCFFWVVLCYAVYFVARQLLVPLDQLAAVLSQFQATVWRSLKEILPFGLVAGLHGVMVAILMDLGRKQLEDGSWRVPVMIHIGLLTLAGLAIGFYISEVRNVPQPVMYLRLAVHSAAMFGVALAAGLTIPRALRRAEELDGGGRLPVEKPAAPVAVAP